MTKAELAATEALAPLKEIYAALPWAFGFGFVVFVVLSVALNGRGPRRIAHSAAIMAGLGIGMMIFDAMTAMELSLLPWVILLAAGCMSFLCLNAARIKGAAGEGAVRKLLDKNGYQSLHDVCIPSKNGTTQIDHVVWAGGTMVCIETKNYEGAIYGDANRSKWTQSMAGGRVKHSLMNPLYQNHGHVRSLEAAVGGPVEGIVVFVGGAKFPKGMPEGVVSLHDLGASLAAIAARSSTSHGAALTWERIKAAAENGRSRESRKDHMRTVHAAKEKASSRTSGSKPQSTTIKRPTGPATRIEPRF